ncbi:MAG: LCP family protein [Chloroflexota bacterium]|nr:LCP family protein [Chloroflexota bacterium]
MTERKPGRLRRWLGTLLFRAIQLALVAGILFFGYRAAAEVLRYADEQASASARLSLYEQTATAIAATSTTHTPTVTLTTTPSATPLPTVTPTVTVTASVTFSPTPPPTATATPTPPPTSTATALPTASATQTPSPEATAVAMLSLAQFVTNTPRPLDASQVTLPAINTPRAQDAAVTATPVPATPTVIPMIESPTLMPTATDAAMTATPRPLPTLFVYGEAPVDVVAPTGVPTPVEYVDRRGQDLMNIVLLGNDGELTEDGFIRTDTMILVSINRTAGTVSMLGLPRDLFVYIPGWTMQRLNLAYIHGESIGWTDGGFGLLRQTILYNFGINVHYYAMVNLTGLREIVDTVGGVNIAVDCAIQDLPLIGADVPAGALEPDEEGYRILPVGYYEMTGGEALWYARSRHNSIEFDRQRRQMQLLRAIWRQTRDNGLLTQAPTLWNDIQPYIETNLTFEDMIGLLPIAVNLDPSRIENFNLIRLYHTTPWQTPEGDFVQLPIYDTIRPMLEDFYTPPTESQLAAEGARIRVLNGTTNADWDRVAADRLAYSGFLATAEGAADNNAYTDTILIDYTGASKGSSLSELTRILNVRPENVRIQPDPNRTIDFEVVLGASYNSCTAEGVQPIEAGS